MRVHLDFGSIAVMTITFILFILALFVKGFTHDLFLEAGIFLVSAKIIIMAYRNSIAANRVEHKLDEILSALDRPEKRKKKHVSSKQDAADIREKSEEVEQPAAPDRQETTPGSR
jgi:hypothetical protein